MVAANTDIADLTESDFVVHRPGDILELVARGIAKAIILDRQLHPDFFDLSTGFAGELVQKCANYGLRLAVVARETDTWSMPFRSFAAESGRHSHFILVESTADAAARLAR